MANPIYQSMNTGNDIINRFNQFKRAFNGDPRQQIQQLMNSGKVTQEQYNRAVQQANQLKRMLGL